MNGLHISRTHQGGILRTTDPAVVKQYSDHPNMLIVTDGISDFHRYFSPIYDLTLSYFWFFLDSMPIFNQLQGQEINEYYDEHKDCYRSPVLDEYHSYIIRESDKIEKEGRTPHEYIFLKPGFIQKYSKYMVDDSMCIIGFKSVLANIDLFITSIYSLSDGERKKYLADTADILFVNVDAAFWELFAKDTQLLTATRNHMANKDGFNVAECTLLESQGV